MLTYSQNKEDLQVKEYFGDRLGTLLSVGENDGKTFSNALLMIQNGWKAHLFEPSTVFNQLMDLHRGNTKVCCYNKGLSDKVESVKFYESGTHVKNGKDRALVSTTRYEETIRWRKKGVQFAERTIQLVDFKGWWEHAGKPKLDFITIDCEGHDWTILRQIDLKEVGCEFLIMEWNSSPFLKRLFTGHCAKFGMIECGSNNENVLFSVTKEERENRYKEKGGTGYYREEEVWKSNPQ